MTTQFSCNPNNSTGISSRGFATAIKEAKIVCPNNTNCLNPPLCCVNQPQATFNFNPKAANFGTCSGLLKNHDLHSSAKKKIEHFISELQEAQFSLPQLNTGLSSTTEKIVFFGIPFLFTIGIIICLIVIFCLFIRDSLRI